MHNAFGLEEEIAKMGKDLFTICTKEKNYLQKAKREEDARESNEEQACLPSVFTLRFPYSILFYFISR